MPSGHGKYGHLNELTDADIEQKLTLRRVKTRVIGIWRSPQCRFDDTNRKKKLRRGDVMYMNHYNFVCSPRAREILAPHIEQEGEFLPIETEEGPYFLFHCLNYLDCLVLEECEFDRYEEDDPTSPIRSFSKMAFRPEAIRDVHCFHLCSGPGALFLTHNFMRLLKEHNFEGLCPKLMWEESSSPA